MLALLDEILAAKPTGVILTTYALTPTFFEYQFVSPLIAAGCQHFVLLCDRHGYQAMVSERAALARAGVDYWVVPVDMAPFAFHAKLCLMWSHGAVRLYVSSANLTKSGLGSNVEVVDRLQCRDGETAERLQIQKVVQLFRALNQQLRISPFSKGRLDGLITQAAVALDSLRRDANIGVRTDFHVLHNLEWSLIDQLVELLPFEPKEILIVSPFFDSDLSTIAIFGQKYPAAKVLVAQGPRGTGINPKAGAKLRNGISAGVMQGFGNRFVHAKTLLFRGPGGSALVTGSANLSSEAWRSQSGKGNFEAVVTRISSDPHAFNRLFEHPVHISSVGWKSLAYQPPAGSPPSSQPRISWAEISGAVLQITLNGVGSVEVKEIELNTREGRFPLTSYSAPENMDGSVTLTADVPVNCVRCLRCTASVGVRLHVPGSTKDIWVKALVVSPDDIASPPAYKRARDAYDRIERGDCDDQDLRALLTFVQNELSAVLAGASNAPRTNDHSSRTGSYPVPPLEANAGGPGVVLESDMAVQSDLMVGPGDEIGGLLDAVPRLFGALLRRPKIMVPVPSIPVDRDSDEDENDEVSASATENIPDSDAMALAATQVLDWVADRFDDQDVRSGAEAMAYMLDFGLSLARYLFLVWKSPGGVESEAAELYVSYVRRLLRRALSTSGSVWGQPAGWFLRVPADVRKSWGSCLRRRNLPGRLLYHLSELIVCNKKEDQQRSLKELQYTLAGCELLLHDQIDKVEGSIEAAREMLTDAGNVVLGTMSVEQMRAEVDNLRAIETPERVAEINFKPLMALRTVTRRCLELKKQITKVQSQRREAVRAPLQDAKEYGCPLSEQQKALAQELTLVDLERVHLRQKCSLVYKDEIAVYDGFYRRGDCRFIDYLRASKNPSCPKENTRLPQVVASRLSDITKPVKCPSCSVLFIPFPEGALDVD